MRDANDALVVCAKAQGHAGVVFLDLAGGGWQKLGFAVQVNDFNGVLEPRPSADCRLPHSGLRSKT
jgi:hypothetical protein